MSLDTTVPRSRRALLAAAVGAGVATVAQALGRPALVRANDPNDVVLGSTNFAGNDQTTSIVTTTNHAFEGQSASGDGVRGGSGGADRSGVYGVNTDSGGYGVFGRNTHWNATGCLGSAAGVIGYSPSWMGVSGASDTSWGVVGTSGPIAFGEGQEAKTGVYGVATNDATSVGVRGYSPAGTGGYFSSTSGTALRVDGKAWFSRSKRLTIAAGKSSLRVNLAGVTTSSLVFAVLHSNRSGYYVRAVVPSTGSFTIYLNKALTSATNVAYFVVN